MDIGRCRPRYCVIVVVVREKREENETKQGMLIILTVTLHYELI